MEVLQTSALPLGDGAGRNWGSKLTWNVRPRLLTRSTATSGGAEGRKHYRSNVVSSTLTGSLPPRLTPLRRATFAWLANRSSHTGSRCERRLERETGFEPATSTLARSHSTTELFPLVGENSAYHSDLCPIKIGWSAILLKRACSHGCSPAPSRWPSWRSRHSPTKSV